jgi:hypothetical protein
VQFIGRGARGKLKEASECALGINEPLGEDLITVEARQSTPMRRPSMDQSCRSK